LSAEWALLDLLTGTKGGNYIGKGAQTGGERGRVGSRKFVKKVGRISAFNVWGGGRRQEILPRRRYRDRSRKGKDL